MGDEEDEATGTESGFPSRDLHLFTCEGSVDEITNNELRTLGDVGHNHMYVFYEVE